MEPDDLSRALDEMRLDTDADLHHLWELLMSPLGFRRTSLWVTLIGPERRPERMLIEIGEGMPTPRDVTNLCAMLRVLLDRDAPGCSVAFLITRPGRGGLDEGDRVFARRLLAGARDSGVPLEPIHVATDVMVLAVAPDDLAA